MLGDTFPTDTHICSTVFACKIGHCNNYALCSLKCKLFGGENCKIVLCKKVWLIWKIMIQWIDKMVTRKKNYKFKWYSRSVETKCSKVFKKITFLKYPMSGRITLFVFLFLLDNIPQLKCTLQRFKNISTHLY